MKISWLEDLVKEGHVRAAARDEIYQTCSQILKLADAKAQAIAKGEAKIDAFFARHQGKIEFLSMASAMAALKSMTDKAKNSKELKNSAASIEAVRKALTTHPEFQQNRPVAVARFNELAKIAPMVASNPDLAIRIIKEKLHSGFSGQDVQSLALIQSSYTPNMPRQMQFSSGSTQKTAADERAGETLATMMVMCKEAGIELKTMGKAVRNALILSGIPILAGVGVGTAKHVLAAKDKKKLQENLASSYRKAMEMGKEDNDDILTDHSKAQQAFQVLAHFSPQVALQPYAAKSFMKKIVEWSDRGPQIEDLKHLSEIERNISSGGAGNHFVQGFSEGTKSLGLDQVLRAATSSIAKPLNAELMHQSAEDMGLTPEYLKKWG